MCGIAGILDRSGGVDVAAAARMQSALRHRGPDGKGGYVADGVALMHTRLSVIDVQGGAQPLYSPDRQIALIANGEIYNFVELRARIERDGYQFATASDCEVIIPLYKRYGDSCVEYLRGMFAFALWDAVRRRLLLARDRMGEKPLYLCERQGQLLFASELRALLASGLVERELDPRSVCNYFHYQFVPEPYTPIKGVRKLPAASILSVDTDKWRLRETRYWSMLSARSLKASPAEALRAELEDAIRITLRSDVPVGLALSGGVDSSAIACMAIAHGTPDLTAIAAGYAGEEQTDERPQARALARQLGLKLIEVEITDDEMVRDFPRLIDDRDDPIGDISGYGYYSVMRAAHEHGIKVMLQGHGIDELFWGYPWVRSAVAVNEEAYEAYRSGGSLPCLSWFRRRRSAAGVETAAAPAASSLRFFELAPFRHYIDRCKSWVFGPVLRALEKEFNIAEEFSYHRLGERIDLEVTRLICDYYLIENGVAQGDRLSMAHSTEMRLPFLDYRFVETVIGLRKRCRDDSLVPKAHFLDAIRHVVPADVLTRPKRGFSPPAERWQRLLRDQYGDLLVGGELVQKGMLSSKAAERFADRDLTGSSAAAVGRMGLILEIWCQQQIAAPAMAREPLCAVAEQG